MPVKSFCKKDLKLPLITSLTILLNNHNNNHIHNHNNNHYHNHNHNDNHNHPASPKGVLYRLNEQILMFTDNKF